MHHGSTKSNETVIEKKGEEGEEKVGRVSMELVSYGKNQNSNWDAKE